MAFLRGHYVLGIEGLALLRAGASGRLDGVGERTGEIAEVAARLGEPPYSEHRNMPMSDTVAGYAAWADSYDEPGNDTIAIEEPAVRARLDELPPGPVLDAACGTGRHAAYLAAAGREVIGVDASDAMLERARAKLPGADLRRGDLHALPLDDESVAGAVCALALSHLPDLGPPVAELARVLWPGGRLIVSNPHPFATGVLGWRAVYEDGGERREIPEYAHMPGDYVAAFTAAGLTVRRCLEPALDRDQARARSKGIHPEAFADALTGVPAVIVWEAERA
jgi:SAM-dependent methyltransferase